MSFRFVFLLRQKGTGILFVKEDATFSSVEYLIFAKKVASRRQLGRTAGRRCFCGGKAGKFRVITKVFDAGLISSEQVLSFSCLLGL